MPQLPASPGVELKRGPRFISTIHGGVELKRGPRFISTPRLASPGVEISWCPKLDTKMRRGLGRIRHTDVTQLGVQEKVSEGVIEVKKVNIKENVSDGLTKGVSDPETQ